MFQLVKLCISLIEECRKHAITAVAICISEQNAWKLSQVHVENMQQE